MKLMGHVRALLLENPEITTDQLMTALGPIYKENYHRRLRSVVNLYRWRIIREARIKDEIFNEPDDQ